MIQKISLQEMKNRLDQNNTLLLDVREMEEYLDGHIPQALPYPLSLIEEWTEELDKDKEYLVICKAGVRSEKACHYLDERGFSTYNVSQGMIAYQGEVE